MIARVVPRWGVKRQAWGGKGESWVVEPLNAGTERLRRTRQGRMGSAGSAGSVGWRGPELPVHNPLIPTSLALVV
jgi:hypothetical protein